MKTDSDRALKLLSFFIHMHMLKIHFVMHGLLPKKRCFSASPTD
jgi:hypothetical protein